MAFSLSSRQQAFRPSARPPPPSRRSAVAVFARKTAAKQAFVCIDCGFIYTGDQGPFEKLPSSYRCPVCQAPKRRFRAVEPPKSRSNDPKAMKGRMAAMSGGRGSSSSSAGDGRLDEGDKTFFLVAAVGGAALLGALYLFLSAQTQL